MFFLLAYEVAVTTRSRSGGPRGTYEVSPYTKPYWNAVAHFLQTVLGLPRIQKIESLIIFNEIRGKIVPTEACAFIRHAFNAFYRDFAMVDTHNTPFVWKRTFIRAMITVALETRCSRGQSLSKSSQRGAGTPHRKSKSHKIRSPHSQRLSNSQA